MPDKYRRLPAGGEIDRTRPIGFEFNGTRYSRLPRRHAGVCIDRQRCEPDGPEFQVSPPARNHGGRPGGTRILRRATGRRGFRQPTHHNRSPSRRIARNLRQLLAFAHVRFAERQPAFRTLHARGFLLQDIQMAQLAGLRTTYSSSSRPCQRTTASTRIGTL